MELRTVEDEADRRFKLRSRRLCARSSSFCQPGWGVSDLARREDAHRNPGIFHQEFHPERDTSARRRLLLGFDRNSMPETFGISPDGRHLTVAVGENFWSLMSADGISGLEPASPDR